ncbi:MAG: DUF5105 domain-containing protein [Clostridia bacterium]|nr:DUF5105 domain-containing protein [Clostridia bacterium]
MSTMLSTGATAVIEDTPAEVVENYFAALASGQQQIVQEYKDCDGLEQVEADVLKGLDYKIEDAIARNDVAVAKVMVTNRDFSKVGDNYKKDSHEYVMNHLYDKDITDKEKLAGECLKIYEKEVAEAADKSEEVSTEIFLPMVKNEDDDWQVLLKDDTRSALMGGLDLPGIEAGEEDGAKAEKPDMADTLRKSAVDNVLAQEEIPAYSVAQVQALDMSKPSGVSVEDLKLVTRYKLVGTEEKLYELEQNYNLNCLFLLGIASHESAYGTMQFHPNNVCGYGYSGFPSINDCLDTVGRVLAKNYLDPSGPYYKGNTIDSVNRTYAADPAWDSKVARKVSYFYGIISENHNKQLEKLK